MKRIAALAFAFAVLQVVPARAINWEGHDESFKGLAMVEDYAQSLPPPLPKPMPKCTALAEAAKANPYEQIPVPGFNCRPDADTP